MRLRRRSRVTFRFMFLIAEASVRLAIASVVRLLRLPGHMRFMMRSHYFSPPSNRTGASREEICHSVEIAARFVPGATCLAKAHVGCTLLNRFGYPAQIKIGVLKDSSNLRAHAWVECDGRVVIGATTNQYVELPKTAARETGTLAPDFSIWP
jgi:hypothetical protein